ncbi:MAG: YvcK family protein [Candidatus Omnitrophica bacterium]|nr:YvcK family protein [Candidatus Omnitrophota bacterium]
MRILKWLYPGMNVKRWIVLLILGVIALVSGTVVCVRDVTRDVFPLVGSLVVFIGIALVISGIERLIKSLTAIFRPLYQEKELVDIVYKRRQLSKGPKLVVIGGGTGLSVLLQGLKCYTSNITAIVTVADDGGSSGRLREQFNILPPGDIRNCLVALADAAPLMQELFQFRFPEGTELAGHNFGNLFITAMTKLTGGFDRAIKESSKVLAISGSVIPATLRPVTLVAEHADGATTIGETKISSSRRPIARLYLKPADCSPTTDVLEAIQGAEAIIFGPGSLYTSVLPNLLIRGIPEAIGASKAIKMYICNVMTQSGETDNYTAADHLRAIIEHAHAPLIEYCVVNTGAVPEEFIEKYKKENSEPVRADIPAIEQMGVSCIAGDYISTENYVRHNSEKIAKKIISVVLESKFGKNAMYV